MAEERRMLVRRRSVLGGLSAAGLAVAGGLTAGDTPVPVAGGARLPTPGVSWQPRRSPWPRLRLRRREDQLSLDLDLMNIAVATVTGRQELRRSSPGRTPVVVVWFWPQSVIEDAIWEAADDPVPPPDPLPPPEIPPAPPVASRVAGASWLAFDVSAALPMPVTIEHLLDWAAWSPLVLDPVAEGALRPPRPDYLDEARPPDTVIELPWRIQLSPQEEAGWRHDAGLPTPAGPHELWHTRLSGEQDGAALVRGVWLADRTGDLGLPPPALNDTLDGPTHTALSQRDRYDIVRLSADPKLVPAGHRRGALPAPITARRLMLTAYGGWLDAEAHWNMVHTLFEDNGTVGWQYRADLVNWRHLTTMARDHYVRVVHKGFAYPFGHRVVVVQISERKFAAGPGGQAGQAYLRKTMYVVPVQRVRDHPHPSAPHGGRMFPFTRVELVTPISPKLLPAKDFAHPAGPAVHAFMPHVPAAGSAGVPFAFHFRGRDRAGRDVGFTCPVVVVLESTAVDVGKLANLRDAYNQPSAVPRRRGDSHGTRIAVAPEGKPGDATLAVDSLVFAGAAPVSGAPADHVAAGDPPFHPVLDFCVVRLPEVGAVSGTPGSPAAFEYAAGYLGQTTDDVFFAASTKDPSLPRPAIGFAADRSGGVATPNLEIKGLSRAHGPIGVTPAAAAAGSFPPGEMFAAATKARILGAVDLSTVIGDLGAGHPEQAPAVTRREYPDRVETALSWRPRLVSTDLFRAHDKDGLTIRALLVAHGGPQPAVTTRVEGELRRFDVKLWGDAAHFLTLQVARLGFRSVDGGRPDVDIDLDDVTFGGGLRFVQVLADACTFGDGLTVDVTGSGITATVGFDLPSIAAGAFTLKNIAFAAGVVIPFDGSGVRFRFGFSSREDPFRVAFYGLGGGGYVALSVGADGVEELETTWEVGACAELDCGVASGSVEFMGGISYSVQTIGAGEQRCELAAFLRLAGEFEVLGGLFSASLEFYVGLSYQTKPERLAGEASMTVTFEVLMVEKSVTIRVRKEFARPGGAGGAQPLAAAPASAAPAGLAAHALAAPAGLAAPALAAPAPAAGGFHFGDAYPTQSDWSAYCTAFAPAGA